MLLYLGGVMPQLVDVVRQAKGSDSVVIVVKGFLSNTQKQADFSEFSFVLDEYPNSDVIGYDWDSGSVNEVVLSTGVSCALTYLCNKKFFPEKKTSVGRSLAFLVVPVIGHLYRVWIKAKKCAEASSEDLHYSIETTQGNYSKVIIIAHSLGCRLLLNALKKPLGKRVEKVVLVAGALEEKNDNLQHLIESAANVDNRFSKSDSVLRWLYRLAEFKWSANPIGITKVANKHINSVDCSGFNCGHGLTSHIVPLLQQAIPKYST